MLFNGTGPAVYADGRWLEYSALTEQANRFAGWLQQQGIRTGNAVSILANNDPSHLLLIQACAQLGALYAPLNARLSNTELNAYLEQLQPALLLLSPEFNAAAAALNVQALAIPVQPHSEHQMPNAKEAGMLLPTGGTTGLAKAAILSAEQLQINARITADTWGLSSSDCTIMATPAWHASLNILATPLLRIGGRVVLQQQFDAGDYLRLLESCQATVLFLVPTMFRMLAEHPNFETTDFSSVRWAVCGGAACAAPIQRAFEARGIEFRIGYGLTECGVNCFNPMFDTAAPPVGSVGKPLPELTAVIRKADGCACEIDEIGELTLQGPHIFSGYYQASAATNEALRDGWLWTGDLARQDTDGWFYIAGRRKDMFISGGENIYPVEIENTLAEHPAILEAAVFALTDEHWGESGCAAIVTRDNAQIDETELQDFLRQHIASYKIPKQFRYLSALPKTAAGKVDKGALLKSLN